MSKKSHNAHNEESNPTAGFLDPLSKMNRFTSREYLKRQSNDVALLPIPLLFDIAIRCLPRVTPMQRSLEDSWLQDLFSKLVRYASAEIASPPPDLGSEQYTLNLIQMLQKISDHKIRLATSKLETVLAAVVKNVENERDTPAHWDLIAACLDVDANVLISPSVAEAIQQTPDEPNRHLASLISCVATSTWKSSPGTSSYEVKLWKFIIPLASAFAKARNLTSFLSIWQEQLVQCQNEQTLNKTSLSATVYAPNVWEDERLSELVSRLVETTLTAGQIENLLQKAQEGVFLFEVKHSGVHSKLEAYLVILDCLINVRLSQSNLDQLAKMLSRVYTSISDTVSNTYDWPTEHKWRLWRVLITIDEHWLLPRESSDIRVAEQLGLSRAISISTQESSNKDIQIKSNILEDVYSFMFILNLASVHAKNNAAWQVSICQLVYKAVEDFLDHQEALCHAREPDLNTANQVARFLIQWDGKINTICSAEVASLVCIWNILMHPNILRYYLPSLI